MGKALLILGILGVLLGGATAIISLLLPQMTRNVSMSEASIGIIAGAVLLVISFVPAVIGLIMILMKRKKRHKTFEKSTALPANHLPAPENQQKPDFSGFC